MSSPLPKKITPHIDDKKELNKNNLDKLGKLQEWALIKRFFFYFILPNLVIGIGAIFHPNIYMFVPIYETDQCRCFFDI
jgi:hypothetical protein